LSMVGGCRAGEVERVEGIDEVVVDAAGKGYPEKLKTPIVISHMCRC
jgi:hypothetical protein